MANIGKFFGGMFGSAAGALNPLTPAEGIINGATKIIGMFKLSPEVKAQMEQQLTLANLDMEKTALVGSIAEMQGQLDIDKQEAASNSVFVSGWRPWIGWVSGMAFAWAFVLQPLGTFVLASFHHPVVLPTLDLSQMMPVLLGMLGLGAMRTYEKVQGVPNTMKKD